MSENNFKLKIQAVLDRVKSIANIKTDIKAIEPKLPKLKIQGILDSGKTKKDINAKVKTITPKIKVDADISKAEKKIRKLGRQRATTTIQPTVDNTQVISSLRATQKETKTLFDKFLNGAIGVNLVRMSIQKVTQAIYQAIQGVKELDTIKTNIQTISDTTDSEVNSMMSSYNAMAKQLSSTTKEVATAANEFLRMGESVSNTNELIKNAQILAKIGMIDSSDAASYLISSMKGYQIAAEDSINIVNKLTSVDMEAAVSAGGLALALSKCSNIANNSGTSMNRLIGYTATVGEVTQKSMSEVGNSFQSIYSRMNNIKIGRFVDDETGESLSDTETVLNKLGIQLRDTADTYRDFDDVLDDVGNRWSSFTQVEQNAISVAIAGTRQRENFVALMNNYSSALEYSETAANSAGSALERYEVYQDSIEAKTNELTTAIESLSTNIISEDLYSGIVEATTGIVEFLDKTNLLKGTLAGLVTMGISKLFVSIGSSIITVAKSTSQLGAAMALLDKGRSVNNLKKVGQACVGLNDKQLKLILSSKGLSYEQQKQILINKGVAESEVEATLTTLGFEKSQKAATASTLGFRNAMKGLGASLKGLAAAHPVLLAITVGIGAIAATVKIIDACTTSFEELKDKISELKQEVSDSQSEMDSISSRLSEVNQKIQDIQSLGTLTFTEEGELKNLQAQKTELENLYNIEKARHDLAQSDLEKTVKEYLNKTFTSEYKTESYTQKQMKNGQFTDVSYTRAAKTTKLEEMRAAASEMVKQQAIIDKLNSDYNKIKKPSDKESKEFEKNLKSAEEARDKAKQTALDIQKEAQEQVDGLDESSESYQLVLEASQYLSDEIALLNNDIKSLSDDGKKEYFKQNTKFEDSDTRKEFNDFIEGLDTEELNILADMPIDNIKEVYNTIKEIGREIGKKYSASDLLDMVNTEGTQEGEESFNKLIDKAIEYGVCTDKSAEEVQKLIDLLVELGVIQGKVQDSTSANDSNTSTLFVELNKSLQSLTDNASLLSTVNKEISETGRISAENLAKINEAFPEDKYPEMTKALYQYQLGLISEQELFAELEKVYESDREQYIKSVIDKSEIDEQFFNALKTNYPNLINELKRLYGDDVETWSTVAKSKLEIDNKLREKMASGWTDYFSAIKGGDGYYSLQTTGWFDAGQYSADDDEVNALDAEYESAKSKFQAYVDNANAAIKALDEYSYKQVNSSIDSIDLDWQGLSGDSSSSASDTAKSYDLIERAIEKIERRLSSLKNVTDDTFASWSDRNKALIDQISTVSEQIELQGKAYDKYMQLANATGLSDYYKDLIQNGAIQEITISDKGLQEQIDAYQDYYDKAINASDAVKELQSSLNELEKSKMDIISTQFEEITDSISHAVNMLNSYIDLADAKNYFATESIYQKLAEYQDKNTSTLYSERDRLSQQFATLIANGTIKEGSEEFNNMQKEINSVNEAIIESVIETRKWVNEIQNLDFEKFGWVQERISGITSEADFFIDLIEGMEKDLYDGNGKYTNEGITVAGLHAQNLNTYLQQADDYANKIKEINELIANDSANKSLIEQKEEYIKVQREAVISAQEERKAIIDLVKEGFDKQIESLSDIIDKYKDLMSINKDAYDYEKSMAEKSETLSSLQKQYLVWQGDNSESGMKNRQELENQIKDTKDDIAESQYDKMISDAERLLDDLESEYENMVNENIDRICGELDNITQHINESSDTISSVLTQLSTDTKLPLTEAMMNIWNDGKPVADINSTVANIGSAISGTNTAIDSVKDKLQEILDKMDSDINEEINNVDDGSYNPDNNMDYSTNHTPYEPSYETESSNASTDSDSTNSSNDSNDGWAIYKKYFAQPLNTDTSVVDRLKSNDIDASFEARSQYWDTLFGDGEYTSSYDQNVRFLDWLKSNGYANGTRSATNGLHLTDEKGLGTEVILTKHGALRQLDSGDHVLNDKMTENLWKLAQVDPSRFIPNLNLNTKLPEMVNRNTSNDVKIEFGDINVKANNPQEFGEQLNRELAKNQKTIKILQEQTIGQIMGHNSLSARSYL